VRERRKRVDRRNEEKKTMDNNAVTQTCLWLDPEGMKFGFFHPPLLENKDEPTCRHAHPHPQGKNTPGMCIVHSNRLFLRDKGVTTAWDSSLASAE